MQSVACTGRVWNDDIGITVKSSKIWQQLSGFCEIICPLFEKMNTDVFDLFNTRITHNIDKLI